MVQTYQDVTPKTGSEQNSELSAWVRLEPLPLTPDLAPALAARIADPLWLLARQWQFAEFQGEDAGSPIDVRLSGERARLSRFLPGPLGPDPAARAVDYDDVGLPLEVLVEREPVRETSPRLAAEAGLQFRRLLVVAHLGHLYEPFLVAYPLVVEEDVPAVDRRGRAWSRLLRQRAMDGRALAAGLRPFAPTDPGKPVTGLPPIKLEASKAELSGLYAVAGRWLRWYDSAIVETGENGSWMPFRQEYALAVSAELTSGPAVLVADEYTDGELDWYSFRVADKTTLGASSTPSNPVAVSYTPVIPARASYPGMPANRFWEFEDGKVHLGALDAGPGDLARMLLVEYALVYGNDWFVVPVDMPVGSLFTVTDLTVRDTFGTVTSVRPTSEVDDSGWRMFGLSSTGAPAYLRDLFFLPPTLPRKLQGDPVEEVALFRDEMANMAWAVERKVQGASGDAFDRYDEPTSTVHRRLDPDGIDAMIVYRLASPVPANWLPFVPVPVPGQDPGSANVAVQLERRVIQHVLADGGTVRAHPKGRLLRSDPTTGPDEERPLCLAEEEVPRAGAVVQRAFQHTRWIGGTSYVWMGRSKRPGKGEGASRLRHDFVEPPRRG